MAVFTRISLYSYSYRLEGKVYTEQLLNYYPPTKHDQPEYKYYILGLDFALLQHLKSTPGFPSFISSSVSNIAGRQGTYCHLLHSLMIRMFITYITKWRQKIKKLPLIQPTAGAVELASLRTLPSYIYRFFKFSPDVSRDSCSSPCSSSSSRSSSSKNSSSMASASSSLARSSITAGLLMGSTSSA